MNYLMSGTFFLLIKKMTMDIFNIEIDVLGTVFFKMTTLFSAIS
jgi:hypothetical protein